MHRLVFLANNLSKAVHSRTLRRNKSRGASKRGFVVLLLLLLCFTQTSAQSYETVTVNGKQYYKYVVKAGEGLYSVSRTFAISIAEIANHNPKVSEGLKVGQILYIPVTPAQTSNTTNPTSSTPPPLEQSPREDNTFRHTVARGETVYGIAQMYHTTVENIYKYNSGARNGIVEGQYLTIPQKRIISNDKEENYRYHTIRPKETLYSVARTYELLPEDVKTANPGLTVETFQIGKIIRIPFFESNEVFIPYEKQIANVRYTVKRGETLYRIAKRFNVSVEDIKRNNPGIDERGSLQSDTEIIIPVKRTVLDSKHARRLESEANRLLVEKKQAAPVNVMRIGLLLPFLDKKDNLHVRVQEYYEGFLLAVEKLKNEGANIELYVFDIGASNTKKLESLLGTLEMQNLNLLIGGVSDEQIKVMSDFSKAYNVKYVVPFSSKNNEVLNNGNIFQINTPQSYYQTRASDMLTSMFPNGKIVIINSAKKDKDSFIASVKSDLIKRNITPTSLQLTTDLSKSLVQTLSPQKENVIILNTGSSTELRKLIAAMKEIQATHPELAMRLFGYPEWQTFPSELQNDFHLFDTFFYTAFYVDENETETVHFNQRFKHWYHRELMNKYPKYGMLGYDTGLFFMTAMHRYGKNFEEDIQRVHVKSLQFAFHFERVNNWGGFINTGVYLINYNKNNMVFKINKSN